jgi:hypothetical protein
MTSFIKSKAAQILVIYLHSTTTKLARGELSSTPSPSLSAFQAEIHTFVPSKSVKILIHS